MTTSETIKTHKIWAGRYETTDGAFTVTRSEDGAYWNLYEGVDCNESDWVSDFATKSAALAQIARIIKTRG